MACGRKPKHGGKRFGRILDLLREIVNEGPRTVEGIAKDGLDPVPQVGVDGKDPFMPADLGIEQVFDVSTAEQFQANAAA